MERYKNNGFCEFLKERYKGNEEQSGLKFFDTDKSLLVIAKKQDSMPLCLIIDDRVERNAVNGNGDIGILSAEEKTYGNLCHRIAKQAGLPLFWIRYIDCEILGNEDDVYLWHSNKIFEKKGSLFERVSLKSLVDVFHDYHIAAELEDRTPQKQENDSLSSAFHLWQRECLKIGIFADLDLIRIHNNKVIEVIELKRSTIAFNTWKPFERDYQNFAILLNFCHRLGGADFHIVFNAQIKELPYGIEQEQLRYYRKIEKKNKGTYYDKIDLLKLYKMEWQENKSYYQWPHPVLLGTIDIEKFLNYEEYIAFINQRQR